SRRATTSTGSGSSSTARSTPRSRSPVPLLRRWPDRPPGLVPSGGDMAAVNTSPARPFEVVASTLAGWPDASVAIAGSRVGAIGLVNLEHVRDLEAAREALARLAAGGRGTLGVKVAAGSLAADLLDELPPAVSLVVIAASAGEAVEPVLAQARASE